MSQRRSHYDVTNTVRISHPRDVCEAVCDLLLPRATAAEQQPLRAAFQTFGRLYAGELPGFLGNDTWYHDAQHSLDCALAVARLCDGHDREAPAGQRLGGRRAQLGVMLALFHDAGYIRRRGDDARHGAEYTMTHVTRSGALLAELLPGFGFAAEAALAQELVHYTGYEVPLDALRIADPLDRRLGAVLGTADVLAQFSDRCYLEKCRDFLYPEFEICGLAGRPRLGRPAPIYASPEELLRKTPEFSRRVFAERLDGAFQGVYRHMAAHFGGTDPYLHAARSHLARLERALSGRGLSGLRRRPRAVNAARLRRILGLDNTLRFPGPQHVRPAVHPPAAPAPRFAPT